MSRIQKKSVSFLLPIDLYDALCRLAAEDNRTFSAELRQILRGYCEYTARGGVSWCRGNGQRGIEQYESSSM